LEFCRDLIHGLEGEDPEIDKLKIVVYNGIASYALSIEDHSLASKFL